MICTPPPRRVSNNRRMPINEPIRIISDLHLGFPSSKLAHPGQLLPLLRGPASVIFNGDSVELHFDRRRGQGLRDADALRAACEKSGARPFFINGNHDSDISDLSHADLAGGAILVTHGDMLYHDISPWDGAKAAIMGRAHAEQLAAMDEDALNDFEKRLHATKRAALALELHDIPLPRGPLAQAALLLEVLWPPWTPFRILKCWRETPGRAVHLAETFRPRAQIIVIGHTHRAGIWRVGPRIVINTGSFMPLARRLAVDVEAGAVSVKTVLHKRGEFVIGREIARFNVSKM